MRMSVPEPVREWYRQPMVWLLIAIPLSAVLMGVTIIILAVVSNDGMVADDYYRRGMEINQSLARDRIAARYGLRAVVKLDTDGKAIHATLRADNVLRFPDSVQLTLSHATQSGLDRSIRLIQTAGRVYQAGLPELPVGRWYVQLHARDWRLNGVLQVPGQNELILENDSTLESVSGAYPGARRHSGR